MAHVFRFFLPSGGTAVVGEHVQLSRDDAHRVHKVLRLDAGEAIEIAERSELLAETLGESVFDFFLRNKRAEWDEYRGQVSAFERDQMLPVI